MNGYNRILFSKAIRPYFSIAIAGILAFAPISFMLRAVKNDILAIEYPINYFMSECIHNGEMPAWFNTWGLGFPLDSGLTWSIYSTPQLLFNSLFNYNIYVLHLEFLFFVLLAGWSMYYLLNKFIMRDNKLAFLLSVCYMLSGFMVGSTQWLLYITAAAFLPLLTISLLRLLQHPSMRHSIQFAVVYTMMFTSVYAAFNIITTYAIIIFILFWFLRQRNTKGFNPITVRFLGLGALFTFILCFPCLYYTAELLKYISRGDSIAGNADFFNSNYVHPAALSNMLLPFSSVRMNYPNTEGTMLHSYAGLFVLMLVPAAIVTSIREKNKIAVLLFVAALLFLLFSFGGITVFRGALNVFPGFSYFRNPAIFRFYFLLTLILFVAFTLRKVSLVEIVSRKHRFFAALRYTYWILVVTFASILTVGLIKNGLPQFGGVAAFIRNVTYEECVLVSAAIQLALLAIAGLAIRVKRYGILRQLLIFDLVINTLICTPFFSVSSYSIPQVNNIFEEKKVFPYKQ